MHFDIGEALCTENLGLINSKNRKPPKLLSFHNSSQQRGENTTRAGACHAGHCHGIGSEIATFKTAAPTLPYWDREIRASGAPHRQMATCGRRSPLSSDGVAQFLHCVNNGKHFVNMSRANPNWLFVRRWLDASSGLKKAGFYKWGTAEGQSQLCLLAGTNLPGVSCSRQASLFIKVLLVGPHGAMVVNVYICAMVMHVCICAIDTRARSGLTLYRTNRL